MLIANNCHFKLFPAISIEWKNIAGNEHQEPIGANSRHPDQVYMIMDNHSELMTNKSIKNQLQKLSITATIKHIQPFQVDLSRSRGQKSITVT